MSDDTVSLFDLHRSKLSWAIGQVEHGRRTITITRHGRPVAQLVPITSSEVTLTDPPGIALPRPPSAKKPGA